MGILVKLGANRNLVDVVVGQDGPVLTVQVAQHSTNILLVKQGAVLDIVCRRAKLRPNHGIRWNQEGGRQLCQVFLGNSRHHSDVVRAIEAQDEEFLRFRLSKPMSTAVGLEEGRHVVGQLDVDDLVAILLNVESKRGRGI